MIRALMILSRLLLGLLTTTCTARWPENTPPDAPTNTLDVQAHERSAPKTADPSLPDNSDLKGREPDDREHPALQDPALPDHMVQGYRAPGDALGYDAATHALSAMSACFATDECSAESLAELERLQFLALRFDTTTIKHPVPDCTNSASNLLRSGFCGMTTEHDVEHLRGAITQAMTCLAALRVDGTSCTERSRRIDVWLGSHSCSRDAPGELLDFEQSPRAGPFVEGQPWTVQVSRVTTVAWAICLEGIGDRVTGVALGAQWAAE